MNSKKYLELKLKYSGATDKHSISLYKIQEGRVLLSQNQFKEARKCFDEANLISEDTPIAYYFIGESYSHESDSIYIEAEKLQVGPSMFSIEIFSDNTQLLMSVTINS